MTEITVEVDGDLLTAIEYIADHDEIEMESVEDVIQQGHESVADFGAKEILLDLFASYDDLVELIEDPDKSVQEYRQRSSEWPKLGVKNND